MDEHQIIPARFAAVVFGFILSGLMSVLVVGANSAAFFAIWMSGRVPNWMVAFPAVLVVAPHTCRLAARSMGQG